MTRRPSTRSLWWTVGVVSLLLVLVSPAALRLISEVPTDWLLLSSVGQAYGFASALLSGLAFLAVAYSLILQQRESRAARLEAHRAVHMHLLEMAIEDRTLLEVWTRGAGDDDVDGRRQHLYVNLLMSYWHENFVDTGTMTADEVEEESYLLFLGRPGRDYWAEVREYRRRLYTRKRERTFYDLVDAGHRRALADGRSDQRGPGEPSAGSAGSSTAAPPGTGAPPAL